MASIAMRLTILAARGDTFFAPIDGPHFKPMLPSLFVETKEQGLGVRDLRSGVGCH
jgi:hypothetical protein